MKNMTRLSALLLVATTTACASGATPPIHHAQLDRDCDAARARFAIGQTYNATLAENARRLSGAALIRHLAPGTPTTREFRPDRLNALTGPAGYIVAVNCG